jgi:hypothetical protein
MGLGKIEIAQNGSSQKAEFNPESQKIALQGSKGPPI